MRRRVTPILFTAACLALAGCSSSDSDKPAKPTSAATSSAMVKQPAADQIKACTDAIAAGKDSSPPECAYLSSDYYFKALQDANQQDRDALQRQLEEASTSAQP
jgi:hypothetical protein